MRSAFLLPLIVSTSFITGCASLLPSSKQETAHDWGGYDNVKANYDLIVPYETDFQAACKLGFDPQKTPNVRTLNHAQVVEAVLPSPIQMNGGVPKGLVDCMKAQDACYGFFIEPTRIDKRRVGNFFLDYLNFRKETRTTGWRFSALIVIVDNKVVYKQWSGSPNILEEEVSRNPLGPLQGLNVIDMF
jgi:hypothetical protein